MDLTPHTTDTEPSTTCSDLTVPDNGMISYNMGTASLRTMGTVATHTCNPGYTLNGGSTRTCWSDGMWSGSAPTCQRKDRVKAIVLWLIDCTVSTATCPDLTVPANGVIIYSSSTSPHPQGTVATQSCLNGFVPSTTSTTRMCLRDKSWNGSILTCECKLV